MKKTTRALAFLSTLLVSAAAIAQSQVGDIGDSRSSQATPNQVSEPGSLPLIVLAAAGAVGVVRYLKNRKK